MMRKRAKHQLHFQDLEGTFHIYNQSQAHSQRSAAIKRFFFLSTFSTIFFVQKFASWFSHNQVLTTNFHWYSKCIQWKNANKGDEGYLIRSARFWSIGCQGQKLRIPKMQTTSKNPPGKESSGTALMLIISANGKDNLHPLCQCLDESSWHVSHTSDLGTLTCISWFFKWGKVQFSHLTSFLLLNLIYFRFPRWHHCPYFSSPFSCRSFNTTSQGCHSKGVAKLLA